MKLLFVPLLKKFPVLRDILLTIRYSYLLPSVLIGEHSLDESSELRGTTYSSDLDYYTSCLGLVLPRKQPKTHPKSVIIENPTDATPIFFLNGIATTPAMWEVNARLIAKLFNRDVHPLYNPTRGFLLDIIECMWGRTLDQKEPLARNLAMCIGLQLELSEKVIVIAHSQGGILMNTILKLLKNAGIDLSRLEVYTFAAGFDEFPTGDFYQEHFGNYRDFVARIGCIYTKSEQPLKLFTTKKLGHLLNAHYLPHFQKGLYCNGTSKLFSYLKAPFEEL